MRIMFRLYIAIHDVPSDWSRKPPVGSGALRSNTPMLSSPRNPPWKMLLPRWSLRFTHQVKLSSSFMNTRSRKRRSPASPRAARSAWNTRHADQACIGGFTSLNDHS